MTIRYRINHPAHYFDALQSWAALNDRMPPSEGLISEWYARSVLLRPVACVSFALAVSYMASGQAPQAAGNSVSSVISGFQPLEVGLDQAQIRTYCIGTTDSSCELPSFALGPSATWNLKRFLAIDASYMVTPSAGAAASNVFGGRITEFLAGPRLEARAKHYGYFIQAESGYLRWDHVITGFYYPTPHSFAFDFGSLTNFVSDVGPGVEYSPTSRIHIRASLRT
jgi:hypothetical protein